MLAPRVVIHATQYLTAEQKQKPFYSVKRIFQEHWKSYAKTHMIRDIEKQEVEKMLACKEGGCFVCYCKECNEYHFMQFGCNSRLCSPCGKRYTDAWAERLAGKVAKGIVHRHLVFTLPSLLWQFIKDNRQLQQTISEAAHRTITLRFSRMKKQALMPGVIAVVHPFGKDLGFKPHVHSIVTEGGFTNDGRFIGIGSYINYDALHREWQHTILKALRKHVPQEVIDLCYRKYADGFCAYVKPERITSHKRLAQYIGRYVRHPAIANSRINLYNGEAVRFSYQNHEGRNVQKVMLAHDFIGSVVQHIPEKQFRLVRYFGAYARRKKAVIKAFIKQSTVIQETLTSFTKKREFLCPKCHALMEIVLYCEKPPPKDMSKISNWLC